MSLDRVARLSSSGTRRCQQSIWLGIAILLPFLLTQALPEQAAMSLASASAAAWEDAEDDGGNSTDEGYRTGALNSPFAERVPARLPAVSQVVACSAARGQTACLVAQSPRGPPQSRRDIEEPRPHNGRAHSLRFSFYTKVPPHLYYETSSATDA
jgi:hypothetical protein